MARNTHTIMIELGPADITAARFTIAPAHELVRIVRALVAPARFPAHRMLLRQVRAAAPPAALRTLQQVITGRGFVPDFLAPHTDDPDVIADLIRATPPAQVKRELRELIADGRCDPTTVARLTEQPEETTQLLADAAHQLWSSSIAELWPAMHTVLVADIRTRATVLTSSGFATMIDGLHPTLTWDGQAIRRDSSVYQATIPAGRGLLLVPTIFGWPNVQTSSDPARTPAIFYPARNATSDWATAPEPALSELLGATRARILRHLDFPATVSDTAAALGIATSTAHHHLRILTAAGLVDRHREGNAVWHHRTNLGDHLNHTH